MMKGGAKEMCTIDHLSLLFSFSLELPVYPKIYVISSLILMDWKEYNTSFTSIEL